MSGRNAVARPGEPARDALTRWRVRERLPGAALLEVRARDRPPAPGRVHLAHVGLPILGDPVYGSRPRPALARRPMLHAFRLGFAHPITGERVAAESPLPDDFQKALAALRGRARPEVRPPQPAAAPTRQALPPGPGRFTSVAGACTSRQDLEEAHRRVLEVHADLERQALEARPDRRAGHLDGGGSRAVLDRDLEDDGDRGAAIDVLPHPQPAAVGREVHRRRGAPVAVRSIADGQQAGPTGRDAPVAVPAGNCSFTHVSLGRRAPRNGGMTEYRLAPPRWQIPCYSAEP